MTVVEDQVNLWPEGSLIDHVINVTPDFFEWQQEIVAGVSGQLVGIDLYPSGPEEVFILSVNKGTAWQTDENDFSARIETTGTNRYNLDSPAYIDLSEANIRLSAGDTFIIGLTGTGEGSNFQYGMNVTHYDLVRPGRYAEPGLYIPGRLFLDAYQFDQPGDYMLQGGLDLAFRTYMLVPEPTTLALFDIKPGSSPNSVNLKSKGVLPVAVLSTDEFDVQDIDLTSLMFGDPLLIDNGGTAVSPLRSSLEDVSGDGLLDLTLKFSTRDLVEFGALGSNTIEGLLTGELLDGTPFEGMDSIRIVPPNGSNANSLQSSAIPEPTTCGLALAALCLAMSRRRAH